MFRIKVRTGKNTLMTSLSLDGSNTAYLRGHYSNLLTGIRTARFYIIYDLVYEIWLN